MTPQKAREILSYNAETGDLIWKERKGNSFPVKVFNSGRSGKVAGSINRLTCGYKNIYVTYLGKNYLAHRLAWMIYTGEVPPKCIDHINGDATDNRWSNLRDGVGQNEKNRSLYINNKSGVSGVRWDNVREKWEVRCAGKYIGRFDDFEEAKTAKRAFEAEAGYTPRHGRKVASYHAPGGKYEQNG